MLCQCLRIDLDLPGRRIKSVLPVFPEILLGAVEDLSAQGVDQADASFSDANVNTLGIRYGGPEARPSFFEPEGAPNINLAQATLTILFREAGAS